MSEILKIDLLLNGILYKNYEYNNYLYFVYFINLFNILLAHTLAFINLYNLINDFNLLNLLKNVLYLLNFFIIFFSNKKKFLKLLSRNFDDILLEDDKKRYYIFTILVIVSSLTLSIFEVIGSKYDNNFYNYCLFFLTFYSFKIRLSSLLYFQVIISEIESIFSEYVEYLKDHSSDIINLISQFLELKNNFNKVIFAFNEIFSIIILITYVSTIYFIDELIKNGAYDLFLLSNTIYFVTYIICFGYYLDEINDKKDYLSSLSLKNKNVRGNLSRKTNLYTIKDISSLNDINLNEIIFKSYIVDIENGKSIDWFIFNSILCQEFKSFEIFGVKINNSSLISKLVTISLVTLIGLSNI